MGCICNKEIEEKIPPQKEPFSWETRQNVELQDYLIENIKNKEVIRLPGTINGQQFLIQNCQNASIYIFDHINSVTVDDCENCTIILGAVKGSVYLRNCVGTTCITACGQFRTRDCRKSLIFIHCATQPIIEASTGIKFGMLQLSYHSLPEHLTNAGINTSITSWTEVFDFTPVQGESNWKFVDSNEVSFALKARSKSAETVFKEMGVTWMGKPPVSVVLESTV